MVPCGPPPALIMMTTKIQKKKIRRLEDLDYCIIPLANETLLFIDRVLYAKTSTVEEARKCLNRVFRTRRCY